MFIYLIEDINDLKYVGKTIQKLKYRHSNHLCDKYRNHGCSSSKLHLEHSIIYPLEECDEEDGKEREQYWINKIDCVNINKLNGENIENTIQKTREWKEKNKDKTHDWYMKNRERILKKPRKPLTREQRDRANFLKRERYKLKKQQLKLKSKE